MCCSTSSGSYQDKHDVSLIEAGRYKPLFYSALIEGKTFRKMVSWVFKQVRDLVLNYTKFNFQKQTDLKMKWR